MESMGFTTAFWIGIPISLFVGIIAGYYGCILFERHKKKSIGDKPFFNIIGQTQTLIHVEAQLKKDTVTTQALLKAAQAGF